MTSVGEISTILRTGAGCVDWSWANDLLVHSKQGRDGRFDIWVMRPDGSEARTITDGVAGAPQLHNGHPVWHPSGESIVFMGQEPSLPHSPQDDYFMTTEGVGKNNNLWVTDLGGREFHRLTEAKDNEYNMHPHFSCDGSKLVWNHGVMGDLSSGEILVAGFEGGEKPRLGAIRSFRPSGETHCFSPDGSSVLMTKWDFGSEAAPKWVACDIWRVDLAAGEHESLTTQGRTPEWNEFARYSPDGRKIIWASSRGYEYTPSANIFAMGLKLDYWVMDADGSNRQQLTYFNTPGHPHFLNAGDVLAEEVAWSAEGDRVACYVVTFTAEGGRIVVMDLLD